MRTTLVTQATWRPRLMIAGLDGLRGFAVLQVILYHTHVVSLGWVGVPIFFVLSGFLITDILIRQKGAPLGTYIKNFYGRRLVRIFPVYYAYLVVLALATPLVHAFRVLGVRDELPWALTYTYDFYQATWFAHHTAVLSHLWSLSVEEQFYLFWPIIIFLAPRRALPAFFGSIIAAGPLVRIATLGAWKHLGYASDLPFWDLYFLPVTHLDAFAMGALLCVRPPRLSARAFGAACAAFFAVCLVLRHRYHDGILPITLPHAYAYVWGYSVIAALSAGLVLLVSQGRLLTPLFRSRPLTRVGRISYGAYLFHYPLTLISTPLAEKLVHGDNAVHVVSFVFNFAMVVPLASASFRWLERPLLAHKDVWFPRTDPRLAAASPPDDQGPCSVERAP